MTNRYIPLRDAIDPLPAVTARWMPEALNRRLTERLNRDEVRTPMQWSPQRGAGFCPDGVTPWLPINDNHIERNVEVEHVDPDSLLSWYRTLLRLRREHAALHAGTLSLHDTDHPDVIVYERERDGDRLLVAANLGDEHATPLVDPGTSVLAGTRPDVDIDRNRLRLRPHRAAILRVASP
jgi:glycosidase